MLSVDKARDRTTGEIVALKKILMHREKDGTPHASTLLALLSENSPPQLPP